MVLSASIFSDHAFRLFGLNATCREAVDLPPSTAMGTLEHYSSDQVTTKNGQLEITLHRDPAHPSLSGAKFQKRGGSSGGVWKYTSGMLQSWNKMCFQGGILEGKQQQQKKKPTDHFFLCLRSLPRFLVQNRKVIPLNITQRKMYHLNSFPFLFLSQ